MKKRTAGLVLLLIIFSVVMLIQNSQANIANRRGEPFEVAVIISDYDSAEWDAVKSGMEQACHDLQVEIRVSLSGDDETKQIDLLQREAEVADAIIISPVYGERVAAQIREFRKALPVVVIGYAALGEEDDCTVAGDDYAMGYELAQRVESADGSVLLISDDPDTREYYDSRRYAGVEDGLAGYACEYFVIDKETKRAYAEMAEIVRSKAYGAVVAMNVDTLQILSGDIADVWALADRPPKLYGFGRTDGIIAGMENGTVEAVGVLNEYNQGYQSIETAVDLIAKKKTRFKTVPYKIISGADMYSKENQPLLFPIVQ